MVIFYVNDKQSSTKRAEYIMDSYNWNHFVFTYFYALDSDRYKGYTYYLTLRNVQYYDYGDYSSIKIRHGNWAAPADVTLSQIIFCNYDRNIYLLWTL